MARNYSPFILLIGYFIVLASDQTSRIKELGIGSLFEHSQRDLNFNFTIFAVLIANLVVNEVHLAQQKSKFNLQLSKYKQIAN